MAVDHDHAPRKLVYLRDRASRPRPRPSRAERRSPARAVGDLAGEATWLGRALFVVAGGTVTYWLLALSGAVDTGRGSAALRSLAAASLAHAFLTGTTGVAALRLLRDAGRCTAQVALAAGALIVIALEGIGGLVLGGDLAEVSLAQRTEILANAAALAVGVWAGSYAFRAQRRDRTS